MARVANSEYLGGIGVMLEVARMCPRCGKRLSSSQGAAARHLSGNGCRPPVFAALPEPEAPVVDDEAPRVSAVRQIQDFEAPLGRNPPADGSLPLDAVSAVGGFSRFRPIPWLRPPDLGEVV